jgi:hypothetical protein
MATMIPQVRPERIPHDSERVTYEALARLPSEYVVMHSYPWLRPDRDREALREGEADFIVLHPRHGLLVLEVKGGEPELRGRQWYRSGEPIRDPFDQARRSRYALLDSVEERTKRAVRRDMLVHGDAVVFPHHTYRGELPLNGDPAIIVDAGGLADLDGRLQAAFRAWSRREQPMAPDTFRALQSALLPQLRLIRCVGADIEAEAARIVQLTADQQATLTGLLANRRTLVEGVAGSGKTLLALEFGVQIAERGEKALLLCFNRHLAEWLKEQSAAEARLKSAPGSLVIDNFHAYAIGLARRAGVEFDIPSGGGPEAAAFWDGEVPMILEQAIDVLQSEGEPPQFDAVIVDEGQDFSEDWWITVESLTRGGAQGEVHAFLDMHQSLRGAKRLPQIDLPARFDLSVNCRNTRRIATSAARVVGATVRLLPGAPDGEEPGLRRARSQDAQAGLVLQELRQLLGPDRIQPHQIAVLGPAAHGSGSLSRTAIVEGVRLVTDAAAWRRGDGVLVSTARAFKGLEADVVILYDLSGFSGLFTRADLYVAWTRAKHRLIAICHCDEARAQIEAALGDR